MNEKKAKHFVLDTNVLIHDANAIFNFEENYVYLPIDVLEELDKFKSNMSEKGRNTRHVIRKLDELRHKGNIFNGVEVNKKGGILKVLIEFTNNLPKGLDKNNIDNRLLMACKFLKKQGLENVIFVSKDINARVKAQSMNIEAQDYEHSKIDFNELYTGVKKIKLDKDKKRELSETGYIDDEKFNKDLIYNQFLEIESIDEELYGYYNHRKRKIEKYEGVNIYPWGVKPLNKKQEFALSLLLDDSIKLVTLVGKAGTGKTLIALAAGIHKVTEERKYKKTLIARPVVPVGKDIGYLPGSKKEKISHWMEPIFDNLDLILSSRNKNGKNDKKGGMYFVESGIIELEALTYMRGRSISSQFIIIDEAQNLTPQEVKTIVSRVGENSKIILTGDPYQIDNPYLDASSNGLTYLVERFKGQKLYGHITLTDSERSTLASLAAELL